MRTENPIYDRFDTEEKQFLERMFVTYPNIGDNFDRYLAKKPETRPIMALRDIAQLERTGWVRRGVREPESVRGHTNGVMLFAQRYCPPGIDRAALTDMLSVHDMPEAIVGDFTKHDSITRDDKHRLERLAAQVIFSHNAENLALCEEYMAQETPLSHWAHDIDKLEAVVTGLMYEGMYPAQRGNLYRPFAEDAAPKLKTEYGKQWLQELEEESEQIRQDIRDMTRSKKPKMVWSR